MLKKQYGAKNTEHWSPMNQLGSTVLKSQGVPVVLEHGLQHPGAVAVVLKNRLWQKTQSVQLLIEKTTYIIRYFDTNYTQ